MKRKYAIISAVFSAVILTLAPVSTVSAREKLHPDVKTEIPETVSVPVEASTPVNWVDDLYAKMVSGDADGVFAIISAPDFEEKCSVFDHEEVVWSVDYNLLTSDGKVIFAIIGQDTGTIDVLYCTNPEHNNRSKDYGYGDYAYFMEERTDCITGEKSFGKSWIVSDVYYMGPNSSGYPVVPGELDGTLHMGY